MIHRKSIYARICNLRYFYYTYCGYISSNNYLWKSLDFLTTIVITAVPLEVILNLWANGISHSQTPQLMVNFSPASLGVFSHLLPKHKVIVCHIVPMIRGCCQINCVDVLPNFHSSMRVSLGIDGCVHFETLLPPTNVINFNFFLFVSARNVVCKTISID